MYTLKIILITFGVALLIEGLIIALFTKKTKEALTKLVKDKKKLRKLGIIEIIVAVILIVIGLLIKGYIIYL
ncbi:MAG TPA: DUF2065 family protein [Candidatus Nanoarchaeia archaeon]|nr:DUF2065 family protein [Candidatus Nanoarchaeia archaeon]